MTPTKKATISDLDLAKLCVEICEDRQAEDVRLYDVSKTSLLADFYLICTGNSDPHSRAISVTIQKELHQLGLKPLRVDGLQASHWMILDYGNILIHIFQPETRAYYLIEELWPKEHVIYPEPDSDQP